MDENIFFNSENDDQEFLFLLQLVQNVPRLRFLPRRPNIFENLSDYEFRERFRFQKKTVIDFVEIFGEQMQTKRSHALSVTDQILMTLR
jgi:hypothetical protein